MNKTTIKQNLNVNEKVLVNTKELQAMLGCGRYSAVRIGEQASAKVQINKRVLWSVEAIKDFVESTRM